MAFKFELISPDGDNVGSLETAEQNRQPGDTLIAHGNVHYKIVSVIPLERISEFVDEPLNGVLAVEPI